MQPINAGLADLSIILADIAIYTGGVLIIFDPSLNKEPNTVTIQLLTTVFMVARAKKVSVRIDPVGGLTYLITGFFNNIWTPESIKELKER